MAEIADIIGGVLAASTGGITGIFGSVISSVGHYFSKKQELAEKAEERKHELELLGLQSRIKVAETESELAVTAQKGAWKGLESSYNLAGNIPSGYRWIDAVRALFRPVLTVSLLVLVFMVWRDLSSEVSVLATMAGDEFKQDIIRYVVYSIVSSASTTVVWWFGDRAMKPKSMLNR